MSKKPDSRLRVYVVMEHRQEAGSIYTESSIVQMFSDKAKAKRLATALQEELEAADFSEEHYEPDYVSYDVTKYYVEDLS